MARNHKFFFDQHGTPCARGPATEKTLMSFLEQDVQGSDHICRDLMDDLTAIEDESDDSREFIGNAHCITITRDGVSIAPNLPDESQDSDSDITSVSEEPGTAEAVPSSNINGKYEVPLKHFREVLEDWEAFILDDQIEDGLSDDDYL